MEGAVRVFAGEFNRSTLSVQVPDSSGASYVVTPTGARCHSLYISGALTEISGSGEMLRCRLAEPTGTFDLVMGGMRADLVNSFKQISVPSFVTVVGRAQMFRKNGQYLVSVRPDSVQVVDRSVRDIWVLRTADLTLRRIERLTGVIRGLVVDDTTQVIVEHYHITPDQLREFVSLVELALASVKELPHVLEPMISPRELILTILREKQDARGIAIDDVITLAGLQGVGAETAHAVISDLIREDECYQPQKGTIKLL